MGEIDARIGSEYGHAVDHACIRAYGPRCEQAPQTPRLNPAGGRAVARVGALASGEYALGALCAPSEAGHVGFALAPPPLLRRAPSRVAASDAR
jgi:hypothetical protein